MGKFVLFSLFLFFAFVQFTKYSYALLLQCCCCYCCCPKRYEANLCVYRNIMKDYITLRCRTTLFSVHGFLWISLHCTKNRLVRFFLIFFYFLCLCREADREKNHALNLMHTNMQTEKSLRFYFYFLLLLCGHCIITIAERDLCFSAVVVVVVGEKTEWMLLLTAHFALFFFFDFLFFFTGIQCTSCLFLFWFRKKLQKNCQFCCGVLIKWNCTWEWKCILYFNCIVLCIEPRWTDKKNTHRTDSRDLLVSGTSLNWSLVVHVRSANRANSLEKK